MTRLTAALIVSVLWAGPALAALPSGTMSHCPAMAMPCHDHQAVTCCSASPAEPAVPAVTTTAGTLPSGPVTPVIAIVVTKTLPGPTPVQASPPHGHQPGDLLLRLSTLLI
ncbi:MAG: hypothetical protein R2752_13440 [Vicinamibacterales bacterium]